MMIVPGNLCGLMNTGVFLTPRNNNRIITSMKLFRFLKEHYPAFLLILALFLLGNGIYRDYGIPWDEKAQIDIARINYNYVRTGDPELLTFVDRYYGPFFEVGMYHFLKDLSPSRYYVARHLAVYCIHLVGSLAFYFLAWLIFRKRGWALLAMVLIVVSPRIFADSLYNAKDIPLLDAYIFAGLTLVLLINALKARERLWILGVLTIAHAITTAIAVSTRISGLVIIGLSLLVFLVVLLGDKTEWKKICLVSGAFLALAIAFTILFWPILWHDPLHQLINALAEMNARPYKSINLYMGQMIAGSDLPCHYLPVWIGITTPLIVVVGFVFSQVWLVIIAINTFLHKNSWAPIKDQSNRINVWLYVLGWLFLPVLAVILLRTTLYDGWRHLFFIYPAMCLISVWGLQQTAAFISRRVPGHFKTWLFGAILLAGVLEPVVFMAANHPFENVYFNRLAGDPAELRQKYELDYWGLSYKQALDYILEHDPTPEIKVYLANSPGRSYIRLMLPDAIARRFKVVGSVEQADYFVSNYRGHPQNYGFTDKYYAISVRGAEIMVVFKLDQD